MPSKLSERATAAKIISRLLTQNQTLTELIPEYMDQFTDSRDRALVQELCYGVMRWFHQLEYILDRLLDKKLKPKDTDIKVLGMAGIYQFLHLRTPPHAIVATTVEACSDLGKPWAKKLLNAVLRRYQREHESLGKDMETCLSAKYAHPEWLLAMIKHDYPENWRQICTANNSRPPMYIRVNRLKITRDKYLTLLSKAGIRGHGTSYNPEGIKLEAPVDVNQLPEFWNGYASVQEYAAQLTPSLLDTGNNLRLLDACAAPGGKLAHILENAPQQIQAIAIESDELRIHKLEQTLSRLQLRARLIHADVRNTHNWWDGILFDRILLDVPCSATGVIRRHPDIKVLRTPGDVDDVLVLQKELLSALWPLLKPDGKLLYITCSILKRENDQQINDFLIYHNDVKPVPINAAWGTTTSYGRQILPGQDDMDGFYYACLQKT
jgi:16S rRNA (cytosine967-C5)-methyltransferase